MGPDWDIWFKITPTPMWLEDFSAVGAHITALKNSGITDFAAWLEKNPEEIKVFAGLVRVFDANQAAAELLQAASPQMLLGNLHGAFDDSSYLPFANELVRIFNGERRFSVDVVSKTFKGERRYLRMSWNAATGHEDDLSLVYVSATNITELVTVESQLRVTISAKDFMLREIEHRVRNTLTLINSLLEMQTKVNAEAALPLASAARRVETLGLVHDSLYRSGDLSLAELRDCVESVAYYAFHCENKSPAVISLLIDVDDYQIPIEAAAPLALLTGELTVNALRHAHPDGSKGQLAISAKLLDGERIELLICDDGVGLPPGFDPYSSQNLGFSLVRLLATQLKAELRFTSECGFSARCIIPIRP